jgi:hypothetical protein
MTKLGHKCKQCRMYNCMVLHLNEDNMGEMMRIKFESQKSDEE